MQSLDLAAAAALLGLHPDTLRERARSRQIPGAKIGKEWRFLEADLLDYFRSHYRGKEWPKEFTKGNRAGSGTSLSSIGVDALDIVLERELKRTRSANTTNLKLISGKKSKAANYSRTRSRNGCK